MGTSVKALKIRIKSVQSTEHITRAMQLVASSKMRKAAEKMETSRSYFLSMQEVFYDLACGCGKDAPGVYFDKREEGKVCLVVIGGDRGLAGGYNNNVFNMAKSLCDKEEAVVLPLGKKTFEYFSKKGYEVLGEQQSIDSLTIEKCAEMGREIVKAYTEGRYKEVYLVYTTFVNMMTQSASRLQMLPLMSESNAKNTGYVLYEPSPAEVFAAIMPEYVSGLIYCGICESGASEQAARRNAMDSATKNAEEMIEKLGLQYNRARQGAITQEITEIVAGAGNV